MSQEADNYANEVNKRLVAKAKDARTDVNRLRIQYAMERFLYRLSASSYSNRFVLKGATLYRVWIRGEIRPTRDIDLLGYGEITTETMPEILRAIARTNVQADGLSFDPDSIDIQPIREQDEYGGIRAEITAFLGHIPVRVPIDIGVGDALHSGPEEVRFPVILEDMPVPVVRAYPKHTFLAEKVETLVRRGLANSRMKDFYDLYLFRDELIDGQDLLGALRATFARRGTKIPAELPTALTEEFYNDEQKQLQWRSFVNRLGPSPVGSSSLAEIIQLIAAFLKAPLAALAGGKRFEMLWTRRHGWFDAEIQAELDMPETDFNARWFYDRLRIQQPHIVYEGLYRDAKGWHYACCPDLTSSTMTIDEQELLADWVNKKQPAHIPFKLVSKLPDRVNRVPERTAEDYVAGAGAMRFMPDAIRDIYLRIGPNFPNFEIDSAHRTSIICVNRELTPDEINDMQEAVRYVNLQPRTVVVVKADQVSAPPTRSTEPDSERKLDIVLARSLRGQYPPRLVNHAERDEELWRDHNLAVLTGEQIPGLYPRDLGEACFLLALLPPVMNLRIPLTLYDHVFLEPPHLGMGDNKAIYKSLGVTLPELIELVAMCKVTLVLPFSVEMYPEKLVTGAIEARVDGVVLSRELALRSAQQINLRVPYLFAPMSPAARYKVAHTLFHAAKDYSPQVRRSAQAVARALGEVWIDDDHLPHARGAVGMVPLGLGWMFGRIFKEAIGEDVLFELSTASSIIQPAMAFNATPFPSAPAGASYDDTPVLELLAGLYSGQAPIPEPSAKFNTNLQEVVEGLLGIDNDVPIIQFAQEMTGGDLARFRHLAYAIANNSSAEDRAKAVREINERVRAFEKKSSRLRRTNLVGFAGGAAGVVVNDPSTAPYIPILTWAGDQLLRLADEEATRHEGLGDVADQVKAMATRSQSEAILVHRIQKKLR